MADGLWGARSGPSSERGHVAPVAKRNTSSSVENLGEAMAMRFALSPTASLLSSGVSTARRGCRASGRGGHVCRHVSVVGAEEVQSGVAGVSWECQEGAGRAEEPPGLPRALRGWRPVPELRGAQRNPLTGHPAPEARGQRRRGAEGSRTRSAAPRLLVSISQVCVP